MPDLVNFMLVTARFCCISLEHVGLSFVTYVSYLKPLRFTFILYEGGIRDVFNLGLGLLQRRYPAEYSI